MLFKRNKRQSVPRQMIWYMSYIYIYIYLYISYKYIYIYIYILYYIIFIYINIYKYIQREIQIQIYIIIFFQLLYSESGFFYLQLTLQQLIQPDFESWFIARSQLGPRIQSCSSPNAGLQVVTQTTHVPKDCYPQLVLNLLCSKIRPPNQLD